MSDARSVFVAALLTAFACLAAGCNGPYAPLPINRLVSPPPGLPAGLVPVQSWRAQTPVLKTFWADQVLRLECRACFVNWRRIGDERWYVRCVNQQGTPIPYLGVLRRYRDALGQPASEVLPAFDISKLDDGLYLLIDSGVRADPAAPEHSGAVPVVREIRPAAELVEIRRHKFWPFRVRIPLVPESPSALTPVPEEAPAESAPRGTTIP